MAQTIWYIPTGLDIWNQKINKAPGPLRAQRQDARRPAARRPSCTGRTRSREHIDGSLKRAARSLADAGASRPRAGGLSRVPRPDGEPGRASQQALAQLVFAGLIDVQDRVFLNRSYTTGHKSFRARATVELGESSAGTTPMTCSTPARSTSASARAGTRPTRWPATASPHYIEKQKISAIPYGGSTEQEREILRNNKAPLSTQEAEAFLDVVLRRAGAGAPAQLLALLLAGKGPRQILDVLQIGAAQVAARDARHAQLLDPAALLRVPQHARLVLRQLRASAAAEAALCRRLLSQPERLAPEADRRRSRRRASRRRRSAASTPRRSRAHRGGLRGARLRPGAGLDPGRVWTRAPTRRRWCSAVAMACSRLGNDPHNQEIAQFMLEDFAKNRSPRPGPPAAGVRAAHGAASQVRRRAGLQPALRQGAGRHRTDLIELSGPRASCALKLMSAQDARGPEEHER